MDTEILAKIKLMIHGVYPDARIFVAVRLPTQLIIDLGEGRHIQPLFISSLLSAIRTNLNVNDISIVSYETFEGDKVEI